MTSEEQFRERTKQFAVDVLRAVEDVPRSLAAGVLSKQLIRSATSVGANYRAACHARSKPDFIAKLGIAQEECDESVYWIELLGALAIWDDDKTLRLRSEGRGITAMLTSSIKTARSRP